MAEKRKINILAILPIAIFVALVAAFFIPGLGREDPKNIPSTRVGSPAPTLFISKDQDPAKGFTDNTLREDGIKMINFWASWCGPCRAEHPNLMKLAKGGLRIYGVNYKDRKEDADRFLSSLGNPFTAILTDSKGRNGIEWGITGVPESLLIDSDGIILWHYRGPITQSIIDKQIQPVLDANK
ncbi:DsbE family thiol:disulfide interchange protein [Profundibacter sp.]|uniref:DsbE family thiol:disulfide interchange protein n=1 Tax=Profundibacter sp. TaxID=3101071 RepID=UPI003D147205